MDSINKFESADYYGRMNVRFLALLWAHLPIALFTAFMGHQEFMLATLMSLLILSVPTFLVWLDRGSIQASVAHGAAIVSFSALLIHLSGGMTEMHFHIFAALGVLIVLAQPAAIVAAVLVVVVHHVGFFFFVPKSLINYEASFNILVVHAVFALSIGIPAFFISAKFKVYIVGVKSMVGEMQQIALGLSGASTSMLANASTLSDSTSKELAAMGRTASFLEELNTMIRKNSGNAEDVARLSGDSKAKSSSGLEVMSKVVSSLGEIRGNSSDIVRVVGESNQRMEQIVKLISEIGTKTKVINEIVFQTKLLSFNASVEAARAGEHGKGFAIVAEEVGNLARMSGSSAKEISDLLATSVSHVHAIIEQTKSEVGQIVGRGQTKIEEGLRIASDCKTILSDIDSSLAHMSEVADQISSSSKEQATGAGEIARAMHEVEQASEQNSSVSVQTVENAASVNDRTQQLNQAIENLSLAVDSRSHAA